MPRVYAIIVNWNSWSDTLECVSSLCRCDYDDLDVVILDNGSTDDSVARLTSWAAALRECAVRIEILPLGANLGFAGANNVGLKHVLNEPETDVYAWLLNNDTTVAPDALSHMMRVAQADDAIGAVGATLLRYRDPEFVETAGGGLVARWHGMVRTVGSNLRRTDIRPRTPLDFISGTCVLAPRRSIERAGFLDERYFLYGEDIDWSLRIREAGFRLAYCPEAEVWHKGGASTEHGSPLHDYFVVKSSLLLVHKRNPAFLPAAFAYSVWRCVVPKVARAEWRRLRATVRGYADFLRQVAKDATTPLRHSM